MKKCYSASITPLTNDKKLDIWGLNNILERNISHGLSGVFILGSMGEWGCFDDNFRENLIKESAKAVKQRMQLLVGIQSTCLELTLANLKQASRYPVDYVLMLPGCTSRYAPLDYIRKVLDASDRPLYYYHCPVNNNVFLSPDEFEKFLDHPNLKGIKNSASDMVLRKELILLKSKYDFELLEGNEWTIDEALITGCDGVLCGIGTLASKIIVEIARAVDAGNIDTAVTYQQYCIELFHGVYGKDRSTVHTGQKFALKTLGLIESEQTLIQPTSALTAERRREIVETVNKFRTLLDEKPANKTVREAHLTCV